MFSFNILNHRNLGRILSQSCKCCALKTAGHPNLPLRFFPDDFWSKLWHKTAGSNQTHSSVSNLCHPGAGSCGGSHFLCAGLSCAGTVLVLSCQSPFEVLCKLMLMGWLHLQPLRILEFFCTKAWPKRAQILIAPIWLVTGGICGDWPSFR